MIIAGNSAFEAVLATLIMAGAPALGAYAISCLRHWLNSSVLTVLLNCLQVFLSALILYIHFYCLWKFDFVLYAKHVMFLAPSLLVAWTIYAACGLVISFIFSVVFHAFKKILSLRGRLIATQKPRIH